MMRDDLPLPDVPQIATFSPGRMLKLTLFSTGGEYGLYGVSWSAFPGSRFYRWHGTYP